MEYNDDGSYLKKDELFGYRVIYPYKNPDGTIHWFNLLTGGSWAKFGVTLLIVALILFSVWAYKTDVATCYEVIKDPCDYCDNAYPTLNNFENKLKINLTRWEEG
jgi:hypothetical protein